MLNETSQGEINTLTIRVLERYMQQQQQKSQSLSYLGLTNLLQPLRSLKIYILVKNLNLYL